MSDQSTPEPDTLREWRRLATEGYQPRGNRAVWAQRCVVLIDALAATEPDTRTEHTLTEYGTTTCPVERVRADVDDGQCSACGGQVSQPDAASTEQGADADVEVDQ